MGKPGRPKKFKQEIKEEIEDVVNVDGDAIEKQPVVTEADVKIATQIDEQKILIDSMDSDKAEKDILLKNCKELKEHVLSVKAELRNLVNELETKQKALNHINEDIKAQNIALSRSKQNFEKDNAVQMELLKKRADDIEKADKSYKDLLTEGYEKSKKLQNEITRIEDERKANNAEIARLTRHTYDIETEISKKEADIKTREEALLEKTKEFDTQREALEPELSRISEIKNENELLLQKIEADKASFDIRLNSLNYQQQKAEDNSRAERARVKVLEDKIKNEEVRLRKWEEDIKDADLQLKAREREVERLKMRYELKKSLEKPVEVTKE